MADNADSHVDDINTDSRVDNSNADAHATIDDVDSHANSSNLEGSNSDSDEEDFTPEEEAQLTREIELLDEAIDSRNNENYCLSVQIEIADLVSELLDLEEKSFNLEQEVKKLNRVYSRMIDRKEWLNDAEEDSDCRAKRSKIKKINL